MPPFILEILQRYCKLVVLGTLGMHGHGHQNDGIYFKETLMLICMQKKILSPLSFLPRYWKLVTLGTLSMPGPSTPKEQ